MSGVQMPSLGDGHLCVPAGHGHAERDTWQEPSEGQRTGAVVLQPPQGLPVARHWLE